MSFPRPHKTTLPNGLRVLVVPMKETPTVTVQVLVATGSHYEKKENNGISHFLEHVCFKGTTQRPTSKIINHEFAEIGAMNNAFTSEEATGYWSKARTKHFEHIFDITSDIYLNSTFPEAEIEKEKGVVIEEINMYDDQPTSVVRDVFMNLLHGDQPAGRTILGPKENIRALTRDEIVEYRNAHYVPSKTVIVIAGGITKTEGLRLAKKYFGHLPAGKIIKKPKVVEQQRAPRIATKERKTEQSHFVLGFRSFPMKDKRDVTASLLGAVLGGGMSSRLFQKLREELGVCYYVKSGNSSYADNGIFAIRAGVDTNRLEEVMTVVLDEVRKLKTELVDEKELKKTKEVILGAIQMGLESSDALADWYGMDEILGKPLETPEQTAKKIKAITAKDLQRVANQIFVNEGLNFAVVGPTKDATSLKKILKV